MALTGLQIQKLLPKTNCKECGSNTCLAFAMKLAAKKADLSECPYASDEAKQVLGAASEPPVKCLEFGAGAASVKCGGETVLYRHEKTFVNRTIFAVNIDDGDTDADQDSVLQAVRDYVLERVGEQIAVDMVAITHTSGSAEKLVRTAKRALEVTGRSLIVRSTDIEALSLAAAAVKGIRCLLASAIPDTAERLRIIASENGHALAISAPDLNTLTAMTTGLRDGGFSDLVLDFQTFSLAERFQTNTICRRAALRDSIKAVGYPVIRWIDAAGLGAAAQVATEVLKYGGICVLPSFDPAQIAASMALRQNIYTDPQKPIQVDPRVYPIGDPKPDSPVFVTTNFSLTYFIVSGEIENSGTSAWLVIPECEGMSVLTAWAAGKFSGASIAKFVKESGLEERATTRQIIIPGYVAQISGELEEGLPGWRVLVGPQEAGDIESFVKARLG